MTEQQNIQQTIIVNASAEIVYECEAIRWIAQQLHTSADGYECGLARILDGIAGRIEEHSQSIEDEAKKPITQ